MKFLYGRLRAAWVLVVLLGILSGCKAESVMTNVADSAELALAQRVAHGLYGEENTYAFLDFPNELEEQAQRDPIRYRDLTCFEVYANNEKVCWMALNAHTLRIFVKEVADERGYRQVRIEEDGTMALDAYEEI